MAAPLHDARTKVSTEAWCVLRAHARVKGVDPADIQRELIEQWAAEQLKAARITEALLRVEGIEGLKGAAKGTE